MKAKHSGAWVALVGGDPSNLAVTHDDVLSYLVGSVQRIESMLASEEPPPWARNLEQLECNSRQHHGNGRTVSVLGAKMKVQRRKK